MEFQAILTETWLISVNKRNCFTYGMSKFNFSAKNKKELKWIFSERRKKAMVTHGFWVEHISRLTSLKGGKRMQALSMQNEK